METCRKNYSEKECLKEINELAGDDKYFKEIRKTAKNLKKDYGKEVTNQYLNLERRRLNNLHKESKKMSDPLDELLLEVCEKTRRELNGLFTVVWKKRFKKKKS